MTKYILFDLDGTLTDPKEGITKSVQYALKYLGIEVEDLDSLCKFIGPPLRESLRESYHLSEEEVARSILKYREYFSVTGIYQNERYPGIRELMQKLAEDGKKLIIATSKPEGFAKQIMEHFDLTKYFTDICGSSMDGSRERKADVIRYALEKNRITDKAQTVMVGDREHDIIGAKENGIASIGVLYGYGSRQELETAGAGQIAETVEDLGRILFNLGE